MSVACADEPRLSLRDLAHVPDLLTAVLVWVNHDDNTIVPHTGAARMAAVCRGWADVLRTSSELWEQAHFVLRQQVSALRAQDPAAPRRPRTAHALFQQSVFGEFTTSTTDGDWTEWVAGAKERADAWRSLSANERAVWIAAEHADKARFERQEAVHMPWLMPGDEPSCMQLQCRRLHAYLKRRRKQHAVFTRPWASARAVRPSPSSREQATDEADAFFEALAALEEALTADSSLLPPFE